VSSLAKFEATQNQIAILDSIINPASLSYTQKKGAGGQVGGAGAKAPAVSTAYDLKSEIKGANP